MELRDLTALVTLAERGSYRRAADELRIDVSTLSRRVQRVEDDLGILLFDRGRHGVVPTSGGSEVLRVVRRIVDDISALRENAGSAGRAQIGRLRLATQLSAMGPRLRAALQLFRASRSRVSIELTEAQDKEILSGIEEKQFDAAILFTPTVTERVASYELWTEALVLAATEQHPLAKRDTVGWDDIRREPLIVQGWSASDSYRLIETALIGPGVDFRMHRAGCAELMGLVAIGEGVMIALESHREVCIPGVRLIAIDEPNATIGVSLAWSPNLEDPVTGSFVALMRDFPFDRPCDAGERMIYRGELS